MVQQEKSFEGRIVRMPRAFEADRGDEAAGLFPDLSRTLREVIRGAGGSSPYLRSLIERERDWLTGTLARRPETVLAEVLETARQAEPGDLPGALRVAKGRVALLAGLADLAGVWSLEDVTGALTRLADLAVSRAIAATVGAEIARGKVPGAVPEDAETGAGIVAIAMGKMGAGELNYSSDIDLICLFDETRYGPDDYHDARAALVRATRNMAAMLSDVTAGGYVFRTDLRLRPDAAVTPVCLSMEAAERYYESVGRTWERAAYIKARPAGGDLVAGQAFLDRLTPFVWRRHLDYAAIEDAHAMRLKIRAHKSLGGALKLDGHDVKLGQGGIREIEFFTQTRQIIAGGRDPSLRVRGTVEGLRALERAGWAEDVDPLIDDYRAHREVEHRVQMIHDQQTHRLPSSDEGWGRVAALMDREVGDLRSELAERFARVERRTEDFFAPGQADAAPDLGEAAAEIVARWRSYPALRSARAAEIFTRVEPQILKRLDRAATPAEALTHIDEFLAGLPAGVQLFSLFDANPQLIDLVVDIAATSPALAGYLAKHSAVFDAVIGGGFFEVWPGEAALRADLARRLARAGDYEAQLLEARRWRNEWHFRVGVHHLRGLIGAGDAAKEYAEIAGAVLSALWEPVVTGFAEKHGTPPGRGAVVLGMGSLGSGALTATSDLDLIVIYDPGEVESSEGRRPLASRTYYARLTQALVTALTAPMGPGRLYEVDMRLRPSGRQGPVATSLAAFDSYQRTEAWTWEHLALTRARPVAGSADLGSEVERVRGEVLDMKRDKATVLAEVAGMRARLDAVKPGAGTWDGKAGPGRMQDVALLAQAGALLAGSRARDTETQLADGAGALGLSPEEAEALTRAHRLFAALQGVARLVTDGTFDPETAGEGARQFLLRDTGQADMAALKQEIAETAGLAAEVIARVLPEPDGESG